MPGHPWLVLPTYDEAENLVAIVHAAAARLREASPSGFGIIVVDDASPDGTGALAERLRDEVPELDVLHRDGKRGLGPAYVAGFRHALAAGAGCVVQMDADFSHDPDQLPDLVRAIDAGADLAIGSRYVAGGGIENWGLRRRLVSRAGCVYARMLLRIPVHDVTSGFKCFRASALHAIEYETIRSVGYSFQIELIYRTLRRGLRVAELPIVFRERREGQSKMTGRIAYEALLVVPRIRRFR